MRKVKVIWLILILIQISNECHYTCLTCEGNTYSKCLTCPSGETLNKLQGYEKQVNGSCKIIQIGYFNIVGLFLLIFAITTTIVFPHQEIFHFALFFQSISLLYIYDILWLPSTDFMLGSFTFFMPFLKMSQLYSERIPAINPYKPRIFFNNSLIESQGSAIAFINLLILALMIIIPIFRSIRRKINKQRPNCLPQQLLDKVKLVLYGAYLFFIQQSVLSIYFGYSHGNYTKFGLTISILYFFSLIFFLFNSRYFQLPVFRNKSAQVNMIFLKIVSPIYIVAQGQYQFFGLILLFVFYFTDMLITNKKKPNVSFNRLLLYKLYGLGVILFLLINYITEFTVNSERISKILGSISSVLFGGQIYCYLLEFVICFKQNYCSKQHKNNRSIIQVTKQNISSINDNNFQYDFGELPIGATNQTLVNCDKNQSLVVNKSKDDQGYIAQINRQNSQKQNQFDSENQAKIKTIFQESIIIPEKIQQLENESKERQNTFEESVQKYPSTYMIQIQRSSAQISNNEKGKDSSQRIRRKRKNKT